MIPFPEHLTYEQAATLPCAALTAWNGIVTQGQVKAGETILVQGTGGRVAVRPAIWGRVRGARHCHVEQ